MTELVYSFHWSPMDIDGMSLADIRWWHAQLVRLLDRQAREYNKAAAR